MRAYANMVLGDYWQEGHGLTASYHIGADKPMEDIIAAHVQIPEKTGINLSSFANEADDDLLPEAVKQKLLDLGYQFSVELYEDEHGIHFQEASDQCDCPEELAAIWVFLLNYVDPDLHCAIEPIPDLFAGYGGEDIGYGLF